MRIAAAGAAYLGLVALTALAAEVPAGSGVPGPRPWVTMRGVYGGLPTQLMADGMTLPESGINAVFIGSGAVTDGMIATLHEQGVRLFAEFNTMHVGGYLKDHPDAAPVGVDGKVCPAPHGWQGVCPTHEDYRRYRMEEFCELLTRHAVDGVWLDYHHSHASWERAEPAMPDTCFCERCVAKFAADTGTRLPRRSRSGLARAILRRHRDAWVQWRCDVFTDWLRQFRQIIDDTRPEALLGTYHCPWSEDDYEGALRAKLAIDLKAQAAYVDVFSPMPYHARFGHADDPGWISRQVQWLGGHLGIKGEPDERHKIWPIVQLSDWGEVVRAEDVRGALDHGSRRPATGVMVFAWGSLHKQPDKVQKMVDYYRSIAP